MWRWTPTEEEPEEEEEAEEEEEEDVEAEAGAAGRGYPRGTRTRQGSRGGACSASRSVPQREEPTCSFRVGCASFARRARVCAREFVQNES